jgi:hypothetical protein
MARCSHFLARVVNVIVSALCVAATTVSAQAPSASASPNVDAASLKQATRSLFRETSRNTIDANPTLQAAINASAIESANNAAESAQRFGEFDTQALFAAERGDVFSFVITGRDAATFKTERVLTAQNGGRTWIGVTQTDNGERRAYVSEYDGAVVAHLDLGLTQFEALPLDAGIVPGAVVPEATARSLKQSLPTRSVRIVDLAAVKSSRVLSLQPDFVAPPPFELRPAWMQAEAFKARERAAIEASSRGLKAAPAPQVAVDVMVAYTNEMVTRYGSVAGVISRINLLFAYANVAYLSSDVGITLNLVGSLQVGTPNSDPSASPVLNELTNTLSPTYAGVRAARETFGADTVVLMRSFVPQHDGCGIAYLGGFNVTDIGDDGPFAYALVNDGSYPSGGGSAFCPLSSLVHEIGHNMGMVHDRPNNNPSDRGATPYAFGYVINPGAVGDDTGDIMSYAVNQATAFSRPTLLCNTPTGVTTGGGFVPVIPTCSPTGGGLPLGVAVGSPPEACASSASGCVASQASACSNPATCADAARALNFTRVKVSQYRASVSCPAALPGGASCSLDVDGNGAYEAAKDGVLIVRRLLGFSGAALTNGVLGTCASRTASTAVESFIDSQAFNVDGIGAPPKNGLTDGLLIYRAMLGLTGSAATSGLTTQSWSTVRTYLNTNCGTSFAP